MSKPKVKQYVNIPLHSDGTLEGFSKEEKQFDVRVIMWSNWRLKVMVNAKRYLFPEISPWAFDHFKMLLRYNKGRALAFLRERSTGKEV